MKREKFTGNTDVDREILLQLSDKDLLCACSVNKYFREKVCNEQFFHRVLLKKYPKLLKYYEEQGYKKYYLNIIYYISSLEKDFNYKYTYGNPKTQYLLLKEDLTPNELLDKAISHKESSLAMEAFKRGAVRRELRAIFN